jgi:hypothetical protein
MPGYRARRPSRARWTDRNALQRQSSSRRHLFHGLADGLDGLDLPIREGRRCEMVVVQRDHRIEIHGWNNGVE